MAFHTPGGGEIQLLKYKEYIEKKGHHVDLMDMWNPNFKNYDVFHFFSSISGSNHICNFVKRLNIPVVISSSLWITEETKDQYPCDEIRAHLNLAKKIVTNSMAESNELSKVLNIGIDKFVHIYNGVDRDFSKSIDPTIFRRHYGIWDPFLLNVGNIEPRKNQLRLAEAAKRLNHRLVLIGHIRDHGYANELFTKYPEIIYIGSISQSDLLISAYKACEVFCLPSTLETPGLAAIEAATAGAKIVITAVGSTKEYFDGSVSYVDPHSIDSIIDAICGQFKSNSHSPRSFDAKKYYWDKIIDSLLKMYGDLLN